MSRDSFDNFDILAGKIDTLVESVIPFISLEKLLVDREFYALIPWFDNYFDLFNDRIAKGSP
jgi:hypothetical protein